MRLDVDRLVEHVLGQRHDDRTRPPRQRQREGARDELIDPRRVVDLGDPLRLAAKHAGIIDLLKSPAPAQETLDLADEQNHGSPIMGRYMHPGEGVGGARPARHEAYAGLAGRLAVRVRHHRGAALVAAHGQRKAALMAGVEHGKIALAGNAKDPVDAIDDQLIDQRARGAGLVRGLIHLLLVFHLAARLAVSIPCVIFTRNDFEFCLFHSPFAIERLAMAAIKREIY